MSTTIPALSSVTDILDNDMVIITHSNGESFKIAGSEINKRNQAVIAPDATPTTLTGAPLKTGNIVRVYWKVDVTGSNTSTGLTLNYNNVNYSVKVPRNGTLVNLTAIDLGSSVYKYLQAYTTLELLYDGTQFILLGNPVLISTANYTYTADGKGIVNSVTANNMNSVTSNAVNTALHRIFNLFINDTRNENRTPAWYISEYGGQRIIAEFKLSNTIGTPFGAYYVILITIIPWGDTGGGVPTQFVIDTVNGTGIKKRGSNGTDTWDAWSNL